MTCTHKRMDFRASWQYFGSQALVCVPQRHGVVLYRGTLAPVSVSNASVDSFRPRGTAGQPTEAYGCITHSQSHITIGVFFWYFEMIALTHSVGEEWT